MRKEIETSCEKCGSAHVEQDPDVLDTWFSSGLWPMRHPSAGPTIPRILRRFYPGSVMETDTRSSSTGSPVWSFFGMEFMDEVPFHTVYLHGISFRDIEGAKMSKTKGNVIDPIERCRTILRRCPPLHARDAGQPG